MFFRSIDDGVSGRSLRETGFQCVQIATDVQKYVGGILDI
jgi:hypothetical protein